ncbi:MAG: (d)CMP kinase [Candidatus Eremiobacteraeota bacterium]|nr:(d)CMP kinase [Candidatus Eremiobacteraeota bacterium]
MKEAATHIAIDGPAASGKTTVGRIVAHRLRFLYLDTGAMYRALTYLALRSETDLDNERALVRLCEYDPIRVKLDLDAPNGYRVFAGTQELGAELVSSSVTSGVSTVAAHPLVRERLVMEQRAIAAEGPVVMAGRDIGTVVLPHAQYKVFLTASLDARVTRRREELQASGVNVDAHRLREDIEERDRLDQTRATSPLRPAADATTIDSTDVTAEEVAGKIIGMVLGA